MPTRNNYIHLLGIEPDFVVSGAGMLTRLLWYAIEILIVAFWGNLLETILTCPATESFPINRRIETALGRIMEILRGCAVFGTATK